jgi:hypothetical protein
VTGLAAGATIVVHLGLLYTLTLDTKPLPELLSRRAGFQPSLQVLETFLVDPPRVASPEWKPPGMSIHLRALRTPIPLVPPKLEITEPAVGDATRDVGSVATAISLVSPEYESERLRAVYRERLESHLAQHLMSALFERPAGCMVRIRQSDTGEIVNVTVSDCGEGEQSALTADIQRAAPLPPPPRADLFKAELVVHVGKHIDVQP